MKTTLLIFGITGDLGRRKLLPALREIVRTGQFDNLSIVGISRREVDVNELLSSSLGDDSLADRVSVVTMNLDDGAAYGSLAEKFTPSDGEQTLIYLSVPPASVSSIVEHLGKAGLNNQRTKILFEKPFGTDLVSARETISQTSAFFSEEQIYRIDHFLAKEMAQNIATLRGGNALLSQIWNNQFVESIDVIASETLDIEGRGVFYEQTGALRDVVQGHLIQLLALTLMDIPHDFNWDELPMQRLGVLRQLQPAVPEKAFRAQYAGYADESGNPESRVETFVALELASNDPRWMGVPLRLITGKALAEKTTEIRVRLKKAHEAQSNCLVLRIQPREGVEIELFSKKPGYASEFETRHLSFSYPEDAILPDAYEHVLVDAMRTRKSLFTCNDEVLRSWEILQPVQSAWRSDQQPLKTYEKGTAAMQILENLSHI